MSSVVPAQGDEYDSENEDHHSLPELEDVPSVVVIKTEPDLQCDFDHENQQEEPHLHPLCKTDPDLLKVTHPLSSGGDQQAKIHISSIQQMEMPEWAGDHEDLDTRMLHVYVIKLVLQQLFYSSSPALLI